ncbi:MAG: substrate-binding domain-containing protein [Chitinophagaceae bacterium]
MPRLTIKLRNLTLAIAAATLFAGCADGDTSGGQRYTDSPKEGTIHISVDESFKPIIDSQIQVFESQHPLAHIVAEYKSEAACFKDLDLDSTRMIIVTRGLSQKENDYYTKKYTLKPKFGKLAYDAIALVLNNKAKDSLYTVEDINQMLQGKSSNKYKVVMDGLDATSTVRFALDSILRGAPLGKNVQAATNSEGVIDYVASDPQSVGLVGISWLGDKDDADQLTFSKKVKIAAMMSTKYPDNPYVYPYLGNIALDKYPMIRPLYYILKENGAGLGSGFMNFLTSPSRGQLIFKRAYLLPSRLNYDVRKMSVEDEK